MFRPFDQRRLNRGPAAGFRRARPQSGLTLVELLMAMTIMAMVAGTLGGLAIAVQQGFEYNEGHATATQHARVALERITRTAKEATANEQFPGLIVVSRKVGSWQFPETLVVWHPSGDPVDSDGLPRLNELVIYCPHWQVPSRLIEITLPGDTRTVPPVENQTQWQAEIEAIRKTCTSSTTLTELVRTCSVIESLDVGRLAAVRFQTRLRPSGSEWDAYQDGNLDWDKISWVQGIYGSRTGLRQTWLRIELQLMPGTESAANDQAGVQAIPFFGSAALYFEMHR